MQFIKDELNFCRFGVTIVDYMFEVLYTVPVLDTWMHVALVYRGPAEGEGIHLYVNGLPGRRRHHPEPGHHGPGRRKAQDQ